MSEITTYGWAACWTNAKPRPFILVHTTSETRARAYHVIGAAWKREGETAMQGWKRAYRKGCRVIRVSVAPAFGETP